MRLSQFKALTFDCYGTLIDWDRGITDALAPWLARNGRASLGPDALLEHFGVCESAQQAAAPGMRYPKVLRYAHDCIAGRLNLPPDPDAAEAFGRSVADWPPFPDTPSALARLKARYQLVILSNIDRDSFAATNRHLGVEFDAIFTAEDIGSYKPDPCNFAYMIEKLEAAGVARNEILHVAQSLFHDHVPAKSVGLATCWIDRRQGRGGGAAKTPDAEVRPDMTYFSLGALADAVEAEAASQQG